MLHFVLLSCNFLWANIVSWDYLLVQQDSTKHLWKYNSAKSITLTQLMVNDSIYQKSPSTLIYYQDADNDGFGNDTVIIESSVQPDGYVAIGGDCDDSNVLIYPGAFEVCFDGIDQNCDGFLTEGCPSITTQLVPENCGITLSTINQTLRANFFSQTLPQGVFAFRYRFRVTNLLTNEIRVVDRLNYIFQLTYTNFAEYNTPYSIEVQLRLNQEWTGEYGPACIVITPPVPNSQLANTSCGSTVVQMNAIIRADVVPVVTNYAYEVSLIEEGIAIETTTLITPNESFNLLQLNGISIKYASEYRVRIKIQGPTPNGLEWSTHFGAYCSVFTPNAPVASIEGCHSEDGMEPNSISDIIFASPIGGATLYRFTLSDDYGYLQTYLTPSRYFRLSNFNDLSPLTEGREYSVKVEVEIYDYFYPGKDCNIKMPENNDLLKNLLPLEKVNQLTVFPNPFADTFSIDLKSESEEPVRILIVDLSGRLLVSYSIFKQQLSKLVVGKDLKNGLYNVIVIQNNHTYTARVIKH